MQYEYHTTGIKLFSFADTECQRDMWHLLCESIYFVTHLHFRDSYLKGYVVVVVDLQFRDSYSLLQLESQPKLNNDQIFSVFKSHKNFDTPTLLIAYYLPPLKPQVTSSNLRILSI